MKRLMVIFALWGASLLAAAQESREAQIEKLLSSLDAIMQLHGQGYDTSNAAQTAKTREELRAFLHKPGKFDEAGHSLANGAFTGLMLPALFIMVPTSIASSPVLNALSIPLTAAVAIPGAVIGGVAGGAAGVARATYRTIGDPIQAKIIHDKLSHTIQTLYDTLVLVYLQLQTADRKEVSLVDIEFLASRLYQKLGVDISIPTSEEAKRDASSLIVYASDPVSLVKKEMIERILDSEQLKGQITIDEIKKVAEKLTKNPEISDENHLELVLTLVYFMTKQKSEKPYGYIDPREGRDALLFYIGALQSSDYPREKLPPVGLLNMH